jgi:hypothetical protein
MVIKGVVLIDNGAFYDAGSSCVELQQCPDLLTGSGTRTSFLTRIYSDQNGHISPDSEGATFIFPDGDTYILNNVATKEWLRL